MKKTDKIKTFVCAGVLFGASVFGIAFSKKSTSAAAEWTDSSLEAAYAYGSVITIPERSVEVNGKKTTAVSVVEYPNGKTSKSKNVTLNVGGVYRVYYAAITGEKEYTATETFSVQSNVVTLSDERSSYSYDSYTYARVLADGTEMTGEKTYSCEKGLMVRLAAGDTLSFSEPIDLRNITAEDTLLTAFATPDVQGVSDFDKLIFTFTDVADPNVYFRVSAAQHPGGYAYGNSYYLAGANGQQMSGINQSGLLEVENRYGTMRGHSFARRYETADSYKEQDKDAISFSLDGESKEVFATGKTVIDLDDPSHFENIWNGFTSGYVRLSVSADLYNASTANFCITQVYGLDVSEETYEDTNAPVIELKDAREAMPEAGVGEKYPVAEAAAYDIDSGDRDVCVRVWFNYASSNATLVQVTDGYFTPKKAGVYTIVYSASDENGNTATKTVSVTAKDNLPAMNIELSSDRKTSATCGELVFPAAYEVFDYIGEESDLKTIVTASVNGAEIDATNGFRPDRAGVYTIRYTVVDYICREAEAEYTLTVETGTRPVFTEEALLPYAFVSGSEYALPDLYIDDYTSGKHEKRLVSARVTDSTGTNVVQAGDTFTPIVLKNGEIVTITYFEGNEEKTYEIPTVLAWVKNGSNNRNELQLKNFFFTDGVSYTQQSNDALISAIESDGKWTFARSFIADGMSLQFSGVTGKTKYDALVFRFTDEYNAKESVSFEIVNKDSKIGVSVGGTTSELTASLNTSDELTLLYEDGVFSLGGKFFAPKTYDSGEPFGGFSSGKILLSASFSHAEAGAVYRLVMLDNQGVTNATADRFAPRIRISGDYGGTKKIGSTVVLPAAICSDVLDPNAEFYVTVRNPDRTIAKDINGVLLEKVDPTKEYTILLTEKGQYGIEFYAKDTAGRGNENSLSYALNVVDDNSPEIVFLSEPPKTAKVGDTLVFPSVSVTDDATKNENSVIRCVIVSPTGAVYTMTDSSNSIVCAKEGTYRFKVFAMDEAGNVSVAERLVKVVK